MKFNENPFSSFRYVTFGQMDMTGYVPFMHFVSIMHNSDCSHDLINLFVTMTTCIWFLTCCGHAEFSKILQA